LIETSSVGVEAAANTGIRNAKGESIVRVDADDYLMPGYLESMIRVMKASGRAFGYPDYFVVDGNDKVLYEEKLPPFSQEEITSRGDFLATGTLYRKAVIEKLKCYDEAIKNCGLENYCLILKLLKLGYSGQHVSQSLFAYRRHGLNVSIRKQEAIINYGRKVFETLGLGSYKANSFHPYKLEI